MHIATLGAAGLIAFAWSVTLTPAAFAQQELFRLTASDGANLDYFGRSVAISGNVALVGADNDDSCYSCTPSEGGAVYFYDVTTGAEIRKIGGTDIGAGSRFGIDVDIDGNQALVGASSEDSAFPHAGAAYLIDVTTGQMIHRLTASDALQGDGFGLGVALDGAIGVVGGGSQDGDLYEQGTLYVFDLSTGQELRRIEPADGSAGDQFGQEVALSGTVAIVAAPQARRTYLFDVTTGAELFQLQPSDGATLGDGVAIDGSYAIAGARMTDEARPTYGGTESGSAYVFDVTTGQELYKLLGCDTGYGDQFGQSVAIEGNLALVGAYNKSNSIYSTHNSGVYAFDLTTGEQIEKLVSSDGLQYDYFGSVIAIDGNRAICGAFYADGAEVDSGGAFIFETLIESPVYCNDTPPAQGQPEDAKLLISDGAEGDRAGTAVAVDGQLALVGAPMDDEGCVYSEECNSGSATLYDLSTGQEVQKFVASDAGAYVLGGARLGSSGDLDAGRALAGAPGSHSAYVFDAATGNELFKLTPAGGELNQFGYCVALDGNFAAIGARYDGEAGTIAGAAYVFDVTTGQQLHKLLASDATMGDRFGSSIAAGDGRVLVGTRAYPGSAYLYNATTGNQLAKLTPSDDDLIDEFGHAVAITSDYLLVGAIYGDGAAEDSGLVYVFDAANAQELYRLEASDASPSDVFGSSISTSAGRALIGAWADDLGGSQSGSAYLFDLTTGQEMLKLNASDVTANDRFGFGVSLDLGRAVVGAPYDDNPLESGGSAYFYDLRESIGATYCTSSVNSTGAPSLISAHGSTNLTLENLELHATAAPPNQPGFFFVGPSAVNLPFGNGIRCVGGGIVRLLPPVFESNGEFTVQLDFDKYGDTLAGMSSTHFQCWYRDPAAGGSDFNLSDGLTIQFVP